MPSPVNLRDASSVTDLFERAADSLRASVHRDRSVVRLPARGRLILTGDLHDNAPHLNAIINAARLQASPDHHLLLQEIIHGERLMNGIDFSHRTLARVAELVVAHPNQVHVVLGNHELAQMTGRGVSKGAGDTVRMFDLGLEHAFGDECEVVAESIRALVRAMPLAVITASGILAAHSLPGPHVIDRFDRAILSRDLTDADYQPPDGSAHLMVWGRKHPPDLIESLAASWNVALFCLGHEHADMGIDIRPGPSGTLTDSRHVILNSDHQRGVIVPIDLALPAPNPQDFADHAVMLGGLIASSDS